MVSEEICLSCLMSFDENLVFASVVTFVSSVVLSVSDLILTSYLCCLSKHYLERSNMAWMVMPGIDLVNKGRG